jgi:putative oxidoreductase
MNLEMLRPLSLLLTRIGTGLLLVLWGSLRVISPDAGPGLANKYYGGLLGAQAVQLGFGVAEIAIGLLVVAGLFRRYAYPLQAAILILGTVAIWRYLLDPLGLYLLDKDSSQILFFPSLTLAAASLVLIAFRAEDRFALDCRLRRGASGTPNRLHAAR